MLPALMRENLHKTYRKDGKTVKTQPEKSGTQPKGASRYRRPPMKCQGSGHKEKVKGFFRTGVEIDETHADGFPIHATDLAHGFHQGFALIG